MARDFLTEEQIGEYQDAFSRFDTGPILDFRPAYIFQLDWHLILYKTLRNSLQIFRKPVVFLSKSCFALYSHVVNIFLIKYSTIAQIFFWQNQKFSRVHLQIALSKGSL